MATELPTRSTSGIAAASAHLAASIVLGITLFIVGGLTWQPPVPKCRDCVILNAVFAPMCPGGAEIVQGGAICQ